MSASPAPRIAFFALGGTIASVSAAGRQGATPGLSGDELLLSAGIAGLHVDTVQFMQAPSVEITLADILRLRDAIDAAVEGGADAVVVAQGTDTLEAAFALDLLYGRPAPVVFTGAMRTASQPGGDGPANLAAAFATALSPAARGCGVLVVFNDDIHAARFVRKTDTSSPATFRSPRAGPIGWVCEGRAVIATRPAAVAPIAVAPGGVVPPVALLKLALGDDGRLLDAVPAAGYQGLVIEAFGGGHVPARMLESLARLVAVMPVVLASRAGAGSVLRETYRFPGSEIGLVEMGLLRAGWLDGPKARILLSLSLAAGMDVAAVRSAFAGFD